jgi:hypothetical protein
LAISRSGWVLPTSARSMSTRSAARCNMSEVSMCPACASPSSTRGHQSVTTRDSARSIATASLTGEAFPPWPFTSTTLVAQSAERTSSMIVDDVAGHPIDNVPGKPACSPLDVIVSDGPTTIRALSDARASHNDSAMIVSVPSGR